MMPTEEDGKTQEGTVWRSWPQMILTSTSRPATVITELEEQSDEQVAGDLEATRAQKLSAPSACEHSEKPTAILTHTSTLLLTAPS